MNIRNGVLSFGIVRKKGFFNGQDSQHFTFSIKVPLIQTALFSSLIITTIEADTIF